MMLIPPALNLGNTNNTSATPKDRYFTSPGIYASSNPAPSTPGSSELSPESGASRGLYQSPPVDGRMFGPKMQSDLPGFHMHAATAVVTGHPGSFPLNSPASYAAGAATAPSHSIVPAHYGSSAIDPASYYAPLGPGYDMKGGDMWSGGYNQPAAHTYYQYDAGFGPQYPYDRCYAMDMNDGVRRKNATRESTNTLKAWLQEHKKNPYPTKGEKIMLAIITKMTLTQVSTWFANARRRLKKENKMTWIPKNRANESGSGTEERRQSDDKDSDEKTDDEDCKSEKDDNEHGSDVKLETETEGNSSCQFGQQNPASLSFTQTPNDTETLPPTDVSENIDNKLEYGRMIGSDIPRGNANMISTSNANATLSDKIHSANMVQNAAATGRYETGQEGYSNNRSIWSPIDTQKNLSMAVRPYHPTFGTDYHSQTSYHHDANGRRLSSSHSQGYPTNYEPAHLTPHMSLSHNTQESLPLHSGPHMGSKMFSPMSNEPPNKAINGPTEHELTHPDPTRRSEYPYTSPVTNLRNYVNGVFHAPPQQVPGAGMCDKNTVMQDKSPNPSGESVVSPSDPSAHYPHHRYDQNYLQHRPQGHSADSVMSGESYMLHRSMSVPYNSYYSDGTNCYPPQGMSDNTGSYYGHRANPVPSLVTAESGTADSTRPNSSSGPHHQGSPPSETMSNRRSSCMGYYENSMGGTLPRSSVPPPPYATQNQLFVDGPPHLTHRPSYDGLNPGSNQSASSHSPRALQTGMTSRDGGNFGCAVTSDDEEMRKMQSGESISDKASR